MQFTWQGQEVMLNGVIENKIDEITSNSLKRLQATNSIPSFYHLQTSNTGTHLNYDILNVKSTILPLTKQYDFHYQEPRTLPLAKSNNHKIHLTQGVGTVNVKPHRYPNFYKQKIERLLTEMMADDIIRHSTSAFSPPVLLIEKWDLGFLCR